MASNKPSKAELAECNRALSAENTRIMQVLSDVASEKRPDARAFYECADGDSVTLKLFRVMGAMAGLVLEAYHHTGGSQTFTVYTLDALIQSRADLISLGGDYTERAIAIDKLTAARAVIFNGADRQAAFDGKPLPASADDCKRCVKSVACGGPACRGFEAFDGAADTEIND